MERRQERNVEARRFLSKGLPSKKEALTKQELHGNGGLLNEMQHSGATAAEAYR